MQPEVKEHILNLIKEGQNNSTKWYNELDPNKDYSKEEKDKLAFTCMAQSYGQSLSDIKEFLNKNF